MKKDLPILIISGQDDPVGKKGKGLKNSMACISNITLNT
jgi:hypothetical protein